MDALFIALLALCTCATRELPAWGQDETGAVVSFTIALEAEGTDGILTCERGCAWKTLRVHLAEGPMLVGNTGIVEQKSEKEQESARFLLVLDAVRGSSDERLHLICKRGCWWQSWGIAPRSAGWVIDECMITPKRLWKFSDGATPCLQRRH